MSGVWSGGWGGAAQGLTRGLLALVEQYRPVLPPQDIVRLVTVLGTMENQLRTTGHPRLVVELLLLRWAMADRTVEISEVIKALGGTTAVGTAAVGTTAVGRSGGQGPESRPLLRDVASQQPTAVSPTAASPSAASPTPGPLTVDRLRSLWPSIVSRARISSPMVGSLLADATVQGVEGSTVTLAARSGGTSEGLAHKQDGIAKLLADWVDGAVKVSVVGGAPSVASKNAPAPRPERLNEKTANAERLKVLRAKDPTLGNAVDALDLELME